MSAHRRSPVSARRRVTALFAAIAGGIVALTPGRALADDCINTIDPLGVASCAVSQSVANAAGGVVQFGADQAERALTQWMVDTAVWLLNQLASVILSTSSPDLTAVAWVVAPLFLILGVVQAILRADLAVFGRILAQLLAVAVLTTGAVAMAQMLIGVVDQLSAFVARNSAGDVQHFLSGFLAGSMTVGVAAEPNSGGAMVPLAFLFLTAVVTAIAGVLIWLELVARTLVIYAALLFFPVLLAAAIWPQLTHVLRRFAEVLVAVIVSKFILVVIIAAGASAISATGAQGQGPSLVVGAGLLLLAAWAPWKFYHLLPLMEAGAMHHFAQPFRGGWHRWRARGWQQARSAPRHWTPKPGGAGGLKIAGQRSTAAARPSAARAAGAAGVATVVGAASAAIGGARAASQRVATGGGGSANGSPVRAGWQRQPGGAYLFVAGGRSRAPRANGRPTGSRS